MYASLERRPENCDTYVYYHRAQAYIQRQAPTGPKNSTEYGTGDTPFMPYLQNHRDETGRHTIPEPSRPDVA